MRIAMLSTARFRTFITLLIISCSAVSGALAAAPADAERMQMRKDYAAAQKALKENRLPAYKQLLPKLQNYPLLPYLEYDELTRRLSSLPKADVARFFETYPRSYLSDRLAHRWLRTLAEKNKWEDYRHFYQPHLGSDPELACHFLNARLQTGDKTAFTDVPALWNVDRSQSKACDPVFARWIAAGGLVPELLWERHYKTLVKGERTLANYISRQMAEPQRALAKLLQDVDSNPKLLSQRTRFSSQSPEMRQIILHGMQKLARSDAMAALELWRGYDAQQLFAHDDRREVQYTLASRLMRQQHPEAAEQLLASMPEVTRADLSEWLIRDALRKQDWEKAYEWLARLPVESQNTERWIYWRARLMEELAIKEADGRTPHDFYTSIAATRSFYGFLAADKLGFDYGLVDKPMTIPEELMTVVEHSQGVQRAREFFILGQISAANREWYHTTRNMSTEEVVAAGRLAHRWGWHRHGIQAMIDAQHWDDLQVRFPLAYQQQLAQAAKTTSINPLFLYAIARQESAFREDARSPVGAMGLMQLMPATAREMAKRSGMSFQPQDLLKPEKNIALGSRYLNELLNQFNGNRILAAAAYNAGPSRVKRWLSKDDAKLPYDVWIETIPFQETRGYVQNVLSFSVIYAYRTGAKQPVVTREEAASSL